MPPKKRKGLTKSGNTVSKKTEVEKKEANEDADISDKNDKSKEKTSTEAQENEGKWTLTNSWEFDKIKRLRATCTCFTSRNELVLVACDPKSEEYFRKIYVLNINGELLQEWDAQDLSGAYPFDIEEVYIKEDKRSYLVVSYGYFNKVEFRDLETGTVMREHNEVTWGKRDVLIGEMFQTPGGDMLVQNLKQGAERRNERFALLSSATCNLDTIKMFDIKGIKDSDLDFGVCCLPDPETPDDVTNHVMVVGSRPFRQVSCFDKEAKALYWKINKLPSENSLFGSKFRPYKVAAIGQEHILIIEQHSGMIYNVYGEHEETFDITQNGEFALDMRPVDVRYFASEDTKLKNTIVVIFSNIFGNQILVRFFNKQ